MLKRKEIEGLAWEATWEGSYYAYPMDDLPTLDELLDLIDQPKAPRLYLALSALGSDYVKGMA